MNKRKESFQGMALSPIFIISVPPVCVGEIKGLEGEVKRKGCVCRCEKKM